MDINELRRLTTLSREQTQSKESSEELRELARRAVIRCVLYEMEGTYWEKSLCKFCANHPDCPERSAHYNYCERDGNFQLRMEDA